MSEGHGWEMVAPGAPLRRAARPVRHLEDGEVRVKVAGCGVCHTDIGFLFGGVRTRHTLPLVLGHEISGVVVDSGARHRTLIGKPVVVPAVIPCGVCQWCASGRAMICPRQVMPGNDVDGGFATHVVVPGHALCVVPGATSDPDAPIGPAGLTLRTLAVVADAVTTPYQAIQRSGLERRDTAIVVGVGGIGGYAAQLARLRGAEVVAIDPDPARLLTVPDVGLAINPTGIEGKQIREQVRAHCKEAGSRDRAWKIFECSGSPAGQRTAFDLLGFGATMMVVGHTHEPVEVRLSNLMAFDARLIGTWGCAPEHYADVVEIVCAGLVDVAGRTETRPLASINETLTEIRDHGPTRRVVLVPDEN